MSDNPAGRPGLCDVSAGCNLCITPGACESHGRCATYDVPLCEWCRKAPAAGGVLCLGCQALHEEDEALGGQPQQGEEAPGVAHRAKDARVRVRDERPVEVCMADEVDRVSCSFPRCGCPRRAPAVVAGAVSGGPTTTPAEPYYMCVCGHSTYWHADGGSRDCEFGSECNCSSFRDVSRSPVCEYPHVEGEELCEGTCAVAGRCLGNDRPTITAAAARDRIKTAAAVNNSDSPDTLALVAVRDGEAWNDRRLPEVGRALTQALAEIDVLVGALERAEREAVAAEDWKLEAAAAKARAERAEQALARLLAEVDKTTFGYGAKAFYDEVAVARAVLAGSPDRPPPDLQPEMAADRPEQLAESARDREEKA